MKNLKDKVRSTRERFRSFRIPLIEVSEVEGTGNKGETLSEKVMSDHSEFKKETYMLNL